MLRTSSCFAILLVLGACRGQVEAPSLMPRAVERQPIDMPATDTTEAEQPADAGLQADLATQLATAQAAQRSFAAERARAEPVVGRAANVAPGGEAWVQAQQAISALEAVRAPLRDIAVAVDALRDVPANAAPGNRRAIDAVASQLAAIEAEQRQAIADLTGRLR